MWKQCLFFVWLYSSIWYCAVQKSHVVFPSFLIFWLWLVKFHSIDWEVEENWSRERTVYPYSVTRQQTWYCWSWQHAKNVVSWWSVISLLTSPIAQAGSRVLAACDPSPVTKHFTSVERVASLLHCHWGFYFTCNTIWQEVFTTVCSDVENKLKMQHLQSNCTRIVCGWGTVLPWTPCVVFTALSNSVAAFGEKSHLQCRGRGCLVGVLPGLRLGVPKLVTLCQIGLILGKLRGFKYIRAKFYGVLSTPQNNYASAHDAWLSHRFGAPFTYCKSAYESAADPTAGWRCMWPLLRLCCCL